MDIDALLDGLLRTLIDDGDLRTVVRRQLGSEQELQQVPFIDQCSVDQFRSGQLVRFRCMVQDMFDQEYLVLASDTADPGSLTDYMSGNTLKCMTYYGISVPGENEWVRAKRYTGARPTNPEQVPVSEDNTATEQQKRAEPAAGGDEIDQGADHSAKRARGSAEADEKATAAASGVHKSKAPAKIDLSFPINDSNPNRRACLIKVYEQDEDRQCLKLNDLIEVLGILYFEPPLSSAVAQESVVSAGGDAAAAVEYVNSLVRDMDIEAEDKHFPTSLYPRIHAVRVQPLKHINSLALSSIAAAPGKEFFRKVRAELHALLSQALFGDTLAGEYLLCNLLSQIHTRKDVLSLGAFPLNVCNLPKMSSPSELRVYIKSLYKLLAKFHTHSVYFAMTLEALNKGCFVPQKDYGSNKLNAGLLQLPSGTLLLIDETALNVGQLAAEGVRNLSTVGELIKWQHLKYDFQYHSMDMDTDVQVLVLSEGKSLLPAAVQVPLHKCTETVPVAEIFSAIDAYADEDLLDNIRLYLTAAKEQPYALGEAVQQRIQSDFVELRKTGAMSGQDLHAWLGMARLVSLSFGEQQLTEDIWCRVKQLEGHRLDRIQEQQQHPHHQQQP